MNRVIRLLGVALLVMAFVGAAWAENANQRVVGKKGIGFYNGVAPVGVRYWMSDGMALDFGVGLTMNTKVPNPGNQADETLMDFSFDVGVPFVLHSEENMIVYFRPGLTLQGDQGFVSGTGTTARDKGYDTAFSGELSLGGEFFLGNFGWPNLSFSGQVGLGIQAVKSREEGAETVLGFTTTKDDVSVVNNGTLGFHIYF